MGLVFGSPVVTLTWGCSSPYILLAFSWLMIAGVSNLLPSSFKSTHGFILHDPVTLLSPTKFMLENCDFKKINHIQKKGQKPNQTKTSQCFKQAFDFMYFPQIC